MSHDRGSPTRRQASSGALLAVEHLTTAFATNDGLVEAVIDVSFTVARGETLGLVGESGSGKSLTALSILRLLPAPGRVVRGAVWFEGRNLLALDEREMQGVRGSRVGVVFQEPATALNPVFTIGDQIAETLTVHGAPTGAAAWARAVELLGDVRVPDAERRAREYPHQLSGGLRQRAVIAMALACEPALLIADEPTTALDSTVQAEVLELLDDLKARHQLALLLITHDFGVVAQHADRVAVMYAGRIVEQAPVRRMFQAPGHPYTRGLLASMPSGPPGTRMAAIDGTVPLPGGLGAGCAFAPRCPERFAPCPLDVPEATVIAPGHEVHCFLHRPGPPAAGQPPDDSP